MKELISNSGPCTVVGLNDQAFAAIQVNDKVQVVKLCPPDLEADKNIADPNTIQAVAVNYIEKEKKLQCAVSRSSKMLSVFNFAMEDVDKLNSDAKPNVIHKLNKRSAALAFTSIPNEGDGQLNIIIAADLAGDVFAFPTDSSSDDRKRLMLGHTASMLTSIKVHDNKIFTADRDEKVRISGFPNTYDIHGFLLGNEEYITDLEVMQGKLCVTTGGDGSIRLFNYETCEQLFCMNQNDGDDSKNIVPVRVAATKDGKMIAVIYNEENFVDLFHITSSEDSYGMEKFKSLSCETPLAIVFGNSDLLVLCKEPSYMIRFTSNDGNFDGVQESCEISKKVEKAGSESGVEMPVTILETDSTGEIKLKKNIKEDGEGYVEHKPWLNGERKLKKKEKDKRRKKRKFEEKIASADEANN